MKLRGMFGALAAALVMAVASPAVAGLDFVDTATANASASTANTRFNGVTAATLGTITMPNSFQPPGSNILTISAPSNVPPAKEVAVIDFAYTAPPGFEFSYANGDNNYDMVIQFGTIAVAPGTSILLNTVQFVDQVGGFSQLYGINTTILPSMTDSTLFVYIPEAIIPPDRRDQVTAVRLTFVFDGAGTSFGINAVANPEPGTIALFGLGLVGLVGVVRRRRRKGVETVAA